MKLNERIYEDGLVKVAVTQGGIIRPLLIPLDYANDGVAIMNPSIINENDQLLVNMRVTNYTLWHSETSRYSHLYGPLQYIHPTHDPHLVTQNFLGLLNDNLELFVYSKIDMRLNKTPMWDFHGLEDARLVIWNDKLYITGCRRDTTVNGQSRMELSQIEWNHGHPYEVERTRIPAPGDNSVYCEKNWMPILDKPFSYIKWANPTEVVKYHPINKLTTSTITSNHPEFTQLRGGTQVIPYGDKYIAIGHMVEFLKPKWGQKDARYHANLVIYDRNFNLEYVSKPFKFMNGGIEFQCGMCIWKDYFLITFAYVDNAAYVVAIKQDVLLK